MVEFCAGALVGVALYHFAVVLNLERLFRRRVRQLMRDSHRQGFYRGQARAYDECRHALSAGLELPPQIRRHYRPPPN